jgi:hypothetical protein
MTAWKAFWKGMLGVRRTAAAAALFYLCTLLFSSLGLMSWSSGLHAALDSAPAAADLLKGQGLDLLAEMAQGAGGSFFISAFASPVGWTLLFIPLALFLLAGAYAAVADPDHSFLATFARGGVRHFLPFAGLFVLNLLMAAACFLVVGLAIAGLAVAIKDKSDTGPAWKVFLASLALVAFFGTLWRNSVGYGQAARALEFPGGLGRNFLAGLAFSLRRLVPVNLMAWAVNALRLGVLAVSLFAWSPGYATTGGWLVSALQLQAGFFALAYLRAAEVGMQVEYMRMTSYSVCSFPRVSHSLPPRV